DPFARQVSYIAPGANQPGASSNPIQSLTSGQAPFQFSAMKQDAAEGEAGSGAEGEGGEAKEGEEQTYGQAPTSNALQFLRDVDVLLKPGAWQADTGLVYTHFANDF